MMLIVRRFRGALGGGISTQTLAPTAFAVAQTASFRSDARKSSTSDRKSSRNASKSHSRKTSSSKPSEHNDHQDADDMDVSDLKSDRQRELDSLNQRFDSLHAKMRANSMLRNPQHVQQQDATSAKKALKADKYRFSQSKYLDQERRRMARLGLPFDPQFAIERQRKQENIRQEQKHKLRLAQKQFTNVQPAPEDVMYREYVQPDQPENAKALDVAVIGRPNAGKSSIMNRFVDANVSAVSPKYNTTRKNVLGVYTHEDTQMVFYDTPGLIKPKESHTYVQELVLSASYALSDVDVSMLVVDAVKRIEDEAMEALEKAVGECAMASAPLLLVMNKMDLVQSQRERSQMRIRIHELTDMIARVYDQQYNPEIAQYDFDPVKYTGKNCFKVSAATGKGIDRLRETLLDLAIEDRSWNFHSSVKSDMSDLELVSEIIREKFFCRLNAEVPYFMKQENVGWTPFADHSLRIDQDIYVPAARIQRMVIGKNGDTLRAVSIAARKDIEKLLGRPVHLYLNVRVAKGNNNSF